MDWTRHGLLFLSLGALSACGGSGGSSAAQPTLVNPTAQAFGVGPAACVNGVADGYACSNIDLLKHVPLADLGGFAGNDIWGWTDPLDGKEYALMGLRNGVAFVDVSTPESPIIVGHLASNTVTSPWRDIKVYADHAYIVADAAGAHGMQVFDLTRLRTGGSGQTFSADVIYGDFGSAHNVAINEDSGFAYVVGSNTCGGGLHMIDIGTPINPLFAGCHAVDGDTHDAQCVNYIGADADHSGAEVCFDANEDSIAIVDVSDKSSPVTIANSGYPSLGYTHQNWLDETHTFLLVDDEFDESNFGTNTRTIVFDVSDLDAPLYLYTHVGTTSSVDHNQYIKGNRSYQANYTSGLRILEFTDLATDTFTEVAFFDTYPVDDAVVTDGAWSVYPFFASGTIIVSDINRGLFILREN